MKVLSEVCFVWVEALLLSVGRGKENVLHAFSFFAAPPSGNNRTRGWACLSLGLEQRGRAIDVILMKKALLLWPDGWCVMEPISPFLLKRKEKVQNFNFQSRASF